jgi:hypothetical protein
MSNVIERITALAGQKFDSRECRVTNPHITARESIELADHIVALIAERDALAAQVEALKYLAKFWINQAKPYQPSEQEFKTWLALGHESKSLRSSPHQPLAEIRAEAGRVGFIAGANEFSASASMDDHIELLANLYDEKIRQGGDV